MVENLRTKPFAPVKAVCTDTTENDGYSVIQHSSFIICPEQRTSIMSRQQSLLSGVIDAEGLLEAFDLFNGVPHEEETTRIIEDMRVGDDLGFRIYELLPNGEMLPTFEETHLVPQNPFKYSTMCILPKPTAEYLTRPHDMEVSSEDFLAALLAFDNRTRVESIEGFAAHENGTNGLTQDLLRPPQRFKHNRDNKWTIWYTLTGLGGFNPQIVKCIPCRP